MPCPVCESVQDAVLVGRAGLVPGAVHDLVECPDCLVRYFDPVPSAAELDSFYNASYYRFDRWHDRGKGQVYARRLVRWKDTGRFLDVGCAAGFFIDEIRRRTGWEVRGVDFGAEAVRFARDELGLDVVRGDLGDAGFPDGYFDYIHMNNVLEHVRDPAGLLGECRRIIKPDGRLYLSVPNGPADSRPLIDYYNGGGLPARSASGHIFFMPKRALETLFERTGFGVQSRRTGSLKRGLRAVGLYPKKRGWKSVYELKSPETGSGGKPLESPSRKKYPDLYYRLRFLGDEANGLPGSLGFGLDFIFLLRPVTRREPA